MNPNNQQPYYNYHQHTPGPPQPQWQAPQKQGWGDPRINSPISSPATSFPPPPPPPPPQGYGQSSSQQSGPWPPPPVPAPGYPNVPYQDTSAWGVKYNQSQQFGQYQDNALRPTLPPRPPSAQPGASPQPAWPGQSYEQKPPTPPPRPAAYAVPQQQAQNFYYPHEQYSSRPSSHHYQPGPQSQSQTPAPAWQTTPARHEDPVSPIDHRAEWQASSVQTQSYQQPYTQPQQQLQQPQHHPSRPTSTVNSSLTSAVGASALGSGGPSDWEHFSDDHHYRGEASPVQKPSQSPQPFQQSQHQPPPSQQNQQQYQQYQQQQQQQPQAHEQQHGRQHSLAYSATPEQSHATPTYTSPPKPTYGSTASPQQAYSSRVQQPHQPPTHRYSVATLHEDPNTHPGLNRPRYGSDATVSSGMGLNRAGTIDSAIDAWSAAAPTAKVDPLTSSRPTSSLPEHVQKPREVKTSQTQTDFPPIVKTETKEVVKVETRNVDPYEDLKDEYRTSLNRYAAMLREERAARSEQEKMKVVFNFVNREVNLRAVLFKTESAELVRASELRELRQAAQRLKDESTMVIPPLSSPTTQPANRPRSTSGNRPRVNTDVTAPQHSRDESFVVVGENGEDDDYSPGGRPRVSTINKIPAQQRPITPAVQTTPPRVVTPLHQHAPQPPSPGANAPMTLDDYAMPDHSSHGPDRSFNATPIQVQRPGSVAPPTPSKPHTNVGPIPFQPARPAYTPFRYTESQPSPQTLVSGSNPANMAYMKMRHEQASESGRILSQEPPLLTVTAPDGNQSATPSRARQQQEEAFIGLLRQQSKAIKRPARIGTPDAPAPLRAGTPMVNRRPSLPPLVKSAESLRQSLPDDLTDLNFATKTHPKLAPINQSLAKILDDFSFIKATVVAWDRENRKTRQKLEAERAQRESENQTNIDNLFHENEIGYADIAGLEEDFKLDEAAKKYNEDQNELASFSLSVYEKITQRLEGEVLELERLRVRTLDILDLESQSASQRIQTAAKTPQNAIEKAPIAEAMTKMLVIFNKIEVRQQKIAEANFEHERRRKRLELSVLYTNGDKEGVKKLEKDFDKAQSMQVLSEARKRDERANKLMDNVDRAAVRGLAENQEWVDEMSNKAMLLRDLVLGSAANGPQGQDREDLLYGPRGIRESMELLQEAANLVLAESRELVQMSSQADSLLNEADFAMFLAEAKIANAEEADFEKLTAEKVREDQKLKDESEGRMNGIQRGPEEIFAFIKDVRGSIGDDKGHQERINNALEAAKRRNLARSPTE